MTKKLTLYMGSEQRLFGGLILDILHRLLYVLKLKINDIKLFIKNWSCYKLYALIVNCRIGFRNTQTIYEGYKSFPVFGVYVLIILTVAAYLLLSKLSLCGLPHFAKFQRFFLSPPDLFPPMHTLFLANVYLPQFKRNFLQLVSLIQTVFGFS